MSEKKIIVDGNEATAKIAYKFSSVIPIYPITPATPMGELAELKAGLEEKNLFGEIPKIQMMESEAGASGTLHGALSAGSLATTFTASQGLLLMLPNMHKIAGEVLPGVMHVPSRSLAYQALSIYGDHSDVMSARGTGWSILASNSVQEAQDFAAIAHAISIKTSIPVLHFFDGFRTSHEINTIEPIEEEILQEMVDHDKLNKFYDKGLRPEQPYVKPGAQNPDVYFQNRERANKNYEELIIETKKIFEEFGRKTGRNYSLFDYYGDKNATEIIISMGSSIQTIREVIDYENKQGKKYGCISVRLFRPFSKKDLIKAIPESVENIAILDKTKEQGSLGEPLFMDVSVAIQGNKKFKSLKNTVGGRYGLGSKEFNPSMVKGIFNYLENYESEKKENNFTIGINDDLTNTSINYPKEYTIKDEDITSCKIWGFGSDGSVSASKNTLKIIGSLDKFVQGHFEYDSKKSGGITISHLRFGERKINKPYNVEETDIIVLNKQSYIGQFNILEGIKENGTFLINCGWKPEEVFEHLTKELQDIIINKNIKMYCINAQFIADKNGLGGKINTIMQTAFFKILNIIPEKQAIKKIKELVSKQFKAMGEEIISKNHKAIEQTTEAIYEITDIKPIKEHKEEKIIPLTENEKTNLFVKEVMRPSLRLKGNDIPVSALAIDGAMPMGTSALEKRNTAKELPEWVPEECIQCGMCSFVCPHAAIRVKQIKPEDLTKAPKLFNTILSKTKNDFELQYKVQVYPEDCTGCGVCVQACPMKDKALKMVSKNSIFEKEKENAEFFNKQKHNTDGTIKGTVKGSQFIKPLIEFSGACSGCGQTPVIKLVTQLFGEEMVIANATGCTSIYGGSFPTTPFATTDEGKGPAWANSLFEDNAEYGLGLRLGINAKRDQVKKELKSIFEKSENKELRKLIDEHLKSFDEKNDESKERSEKIKELCKKENYDLDSDYLTEKSVWIIGGDGWAYDIGFNGVDQVTSLDENVNILILDNGQYANTGGQLSKATPKSARVPFASTGKKTIKKDLAAMMRNYPHAFVATINLGANPQHAISTIIAAEKHKGPSIIIANTACINHGYDLRYSNQHGMLMTQSGLWPLTVRDPEKETFLVQSKTIKDVEEIFSIENRFSSLKRLYKKKAEALIKEVKEDIKEKDEQNNCGTDCSKKHNSK